MEEPLDLQVQTDANWLVNPRNRGGLVSHLAEGGEARAQGTHISPSSSAHQSSADWLGKYLRPIGALRI